MLSGFTGDEGVSSLCGDQLELCYLDGEYLELLKLIIKRPTTFSKWLKERTLKKLFSPVTTIPELSSGILRQEQLDRQSNPLRKNNLKNRTDLTVSRLNGWSRLLADPVSVRFETEYAAAVVCGMEHRYPLADIRLLSLYHAFPVTQKVHHGVSRLLIRKAIRDRLPASHVWEQKKTTAAVPGVMLLKKKDNEKILAYIDQQSQDEHPYIDFSVMKEKLRLVLNHQQTSKKRPFSGQQDSAIQLMRFTEQNN